MHDRGIRETIGGVRTFHVPAFSPSTFSRNSIVCRGEKKGTPTNNRYESRYNHKLQGPPGGPGSALLKESESQVRQGGLAVYGCTELRTYCSSVC